MSLLHFIGEQGLSFSPGMVVLEPQVGEVATFALGACWSPVLFLQPRCHTHVPRNSLLLGNAFSEECRAAQMGGEECNIFSSYIFKVFLILPHLSHCCLISHSFYSSKWVLRTEFQRGKWDVLRQGMGLIKTAKEVTLRNAKQSRHGHCCMMWVGSTKWKWVSITFL